MLRFRRRGEREREPDGAHPLIDLRDIYKIYTMGDMEVHANDGISLQINRGEFVSIVGKSGSGKSTIMNIQLVSVSERTREIGIRKSLGARQRVILRQFIIEAGLQSSIGGLLGIALGSGLTVLASSLIGLDVPPSATAILLSFVVSAGIGVLFGYMPARRAARLNPIDALRSE